MPAHPFGSDIDLNKGYILNFGVQVLASAPSSPVQGQFYFDSGTNHLYVYNGTSWEQASGGTGTGTVTSVAMTVPAGFSVSGSPVTSSGTLAVTLSSQTAYKVLASGSSTGTPSFQVLDHNWISDFDTQVRTSRLDQMAAPTGNVSMNSNRLTDLTDPSGAQDAATKNYVDTVAQGLDPKPGARVATAAALPACTYSNGTSGVGATLTGNSNGALTVDGYAVSAGDNVLVKDQASGLQNGLYTVTQAGSGGTPFILTRNAAMDTTGEFQTAYVVVEDAGTTNANSFWVCTNSADPTVGTTAITFSQLNGATQLTAGTGVTLSGNTISITSAYRGNGIGTVNGFAYGDGAGTITAATLANLRTLGGLSKYSALIGNGSATQFTINQATHGLSANQQLQVTVVEVATEQVWIVSTKVSTGGTVTLDFNTAPTSNQFRVTIVG